MFKIETRILFSLVCHFILFGFVILLVNSISSTNESYGVGLVDEISTIDNNTALKLSEVTNLTPEYYDKFHNTTLEEGDLDNKFQPDRIYTLVAENINIEIAPNKKVLAWTLNGTMPGPTIRITEGENITVKFINKSPMPHTLHFPGYHDELNDGVIPIVMPGQTYLYNITGSPSGVLLYYCHVVPTSQHIKMGMYGAMIIDPKNKTTIPPAKEFVLVMSEFNIHNPLAFLADYYLVNGYADQYLHSPIKANQNDTVRLYVINAGVNLPYSIHLHGTIFKAYPSGLFANSPIESQSIMIGPGDASIIEAKWGYPGSYLFHSHGLQQEHGSRGMIEITPRELEGSTFQQPLNHTVSMIDNQYQLQTGLQKPPTSFSAENDSKEIEKYQDSFNFENILKRGLNNNTVYVSIVLNAGLPNNDNFYSPATIKVHKGQEVKWTNKDELIHTVTSGDPSTGSNGLFDSGTMTSTEGFSTLFMDEGIFNYYCIYHPWMFGKVVVE